MLNWLWNLGKPKATVYEVTGVFRTQTVTIRYWKAANSEDGELERQAVHAAVAQVVPPTRGDQRGLRRYVTAIAAIADLNALEGTWADDPDRRGVVMYRDWP